MYKNNLNFSSVEEELNSNQEKIQNRKNRRKSILKIVDIGIVAVLLGLLLYTFVWPWLKDGEAPPENRGLSFNQDCEIIELEKSSEDVMVSYCAKEIDIYYNQVSYEKFLPLGERVFNTNELSVFKGEIMDVKNIRIDIGGEVFYNAVADIKIDKSYTEYETEGETVKVLLGKAGLGIKIDDSDTVSDSVMKNKGVKGIFAFIRYDGEASAEVNEDILFYSDFCSYALPNGAEFSRIYSGESIIYADSGLIPPREEEYSAEDLDAVISALIDPETGNISVLNRNESS